MLYWYGTRNVKNEISMLPITTIHSTGVIGNPTYTKLQKYQYGSVVVASSDLSFLSRQCFVVKVENSFPVCKIYTFTYRVVLNLHFKRGINLWSTFLKCHIFGILFGVDFLSKDTLNTELKYTIKESLDQKY